MNGHSGNKRYRTLVNSVKAEYLSPKTRKMQKSHIAAQIVWTVRESDPPGRFLKVDKNTGMWQEIGDKAAFRKTGQALRENSSEYRSCWRNKLAAADGDSESISSTDEKGGDSTSKRGESTMREV